MHEHHVGVLGMHPVKAIPDEAMVVKLDPTREGDLGARGDQDLILGAALGGDELPAVDERRCECTVIGSVANSEFA